MFLFGEYFFFPKEKKFPYSKTWVVIPIPSTVTGKFVLSYICRMGGFHKYNVNT